MKLNKKTLVLLAILALLIVALLITITGTVEYLGSLLIYSLFFGGISLTLLGFILALIKKYRRFTNNLVTIGLAMITISCAIWAFTFATSYHF